MTTKRSGTSPACAASGRSAGPAFGEGVGPAGVMVGLFRCDLTGEKEVRQAFVESVHAVAGPDLHETGDLFDFSLPDAGAHSMVHDHHFAGEHASAAVCARQEPLGNDRLQAVGKLGDDLGLLVAGKDVDEAVEAFWGIDGVEGADDEMPGLGGSDGGPDRFEVAQFADEDDVGVLPQDMPEGGGEAMGIDSDLALFDDAGGVLKNVFDRIFHRDDDAGAEPADVFDHGRERGAFARAGDAGDQDQAFAKVAELLDDGSVAEFRQGRDVFGDEAEGRLEVAAIVMSVGAKAAGAFDLQREVEFPFLFQLGALPFGEDAVDQLAAGGCVQVGCSEWSERAIAAAKGRGSHGEMEVGTFALLHGAKQFDHVQRPGWERRETVMGIRRRGGRRGYRLRFLWGRSASEHGGMGRGGRRAAES